MKVSEQFLPKVGKLTLTSLSLKNDMMQEMANVMKANKDFFDKKDWGYLASFQDQNGNFVLIKDISKSSDNNNGYHVVCLTTDDDERIAFSELSLDDCLSVFMQIEEMIV